MSHGDIGHSVAFRQSQAKGKNALSDDFVLEKSIFNNIFEKDIRRVFIYKKAERLAKAIHLIAPAFVESVALRNRIESIAVGLVDAAILAPGAARTALSRELLALSSILSVARTGGLLSFMNAELITREAHTLLQEIAAYEEPRLFLDEVPTLSGIARKAHAQGTLEAHDPAPAPHRDTPRPAARGKIKDISDSPVKDRRESILSVIQNKGKASIKDISTHVRGVSEKTIQRELNSLIGQGEVLREGERRWSTYSLP